MSSGATTQMDLAATMLRTLYRGQYLRVSEQIWRAFAFRLCKLGTSNFEFCFLYSKCDFSLCMQIFLTKMVASGFEVYFNRVIGGFWLMNECEKCF